MSEAVRELLSAARIAVKTLEIDARDSGAPQWPFVGPLRDAIARVEAEEATHV